jgi:hypothetical protein
LALGVPVITTTGTPGRFENPMNVAGGLIYLKKILPKHWEWLCKKLQRI